MDPELQKAIEVIQQGDEERGRRMLLEVVGNDPDSEEGWLWLSKLVEGNRRKQALQRVLEINPENAHAAQELAKLDSGKYNIELNTSERREIPLLLAIISVVLVLACICGVIGILVVRVQVPRVAQLLAADILGLEPSETTIRATRKPRVSCPDDEVISYLDELDLLLEEWDDTVEIAESTSRIGLSPVIKEMQDIRRNARQISSPECGNYLHDMVIVAMESRIDMFLAFLAQESDSVVARKMEGADKVRQTVNAEIDTFREDAMAAYLASDTSAEQLQAEAEEAAPFELPEGWQDVSFPNRHNLVMSLPAGWMHMTAGDGDEYLDVRNDDRTMDLFITALSEPDLTDLESDAARLFSLQTVLETSDYDFYLEQNAETGVYAQNKGYVVEFSRRFDSGDDIEEVVWAAVVTPQDDEVFFIVTTERDEFAQIDLLRLYEIFGSVRRSESGTSG